MLRGPFKPHEYGLVILPMTVVKRFHDCLLPTHEAVLAQYEKVKNFAAMDGFLTKAYGEFKHEEIYGGKSGAYCHSKIYDSDEFGYKKIVVEHPQRAVRW